MAEVHLAALIVAVLAAFVTCAVWYAMFARQRLALNVAAELVEHGLWLSLIGSTEGAPRDEGPPRRSTRDVMNAIEPALEIVQLRSTEFTVCEEQLKSWLCLARKRAIAAQPSTRR
jgi:hypothetical protein